MRGRKPISSPVVLSRTWFRYLNPREGTETLTFGKVSNYWLSSDTLIPVRGRKRIKYKFLFFHFGSDTLIPVRGRKHVLRLVVKHFMRSDTLIPVRGRKRVGFV